MAQRTERLYLRDPLLSRFEASIIEVREHKNQHALVLDCSAFYPESGGQMADRGQLGSAAVIDVQLTEGGEVLHMLDAAPENLKVGDRVVGQIELLRRKRFRARHTGQHMFSAALYKIAKIETVSARLGETLCTLDIDRPALDEKLLADAVSLVNEKIEDALEVRAHFPSKDELGKFALRRAPKVEGQVRLIEVEGFDVTPCGGTHVNSTSEVRLLRALGIERQKGLTRINFDAGAPALRGLLGEAAALKKIGRKLTCGPLEVSESVLKLAEENTALRSRLKKLSGLAARAICEELKAGERSRVIAELDDVELLKVVAASLAREGKTALLAASTKDGLKVIAQRSDGDALDCGAFIKSICKVADGRGGGTAARAEGKIKPLSRPNELKVPGGSGGSDGSDGSDGREDWASLVASTLKTMGMS